MGPPRFRVPQLADPLRYARNAGNHQNRGDGEEAIKALGFRQFRVRFHGELVRIEISREELQRAFSLEMAEAFTKSSSLWDSTTSRSTCRDTGRAR